LFPDLSLVTSSAVIYALGHAFFTLALGAGAMLVYGAYLPKDTRIGSNICIIAILDVLVALVSGLAIFSIVFEFDLPPAGGAGLMFKVLPIAFAKMPAGQWFGGLFFLLLWFAAWTSSISMAEPLVVLLVERLRMTRRLASCVVGALCWGLGIMALLSFNVWQEVRLLGQFSIFEAMADLTTNIILPVGGLFFAIFAGWILTPKESKAGLVMDSHSTFKIWQFLIRYVAPIGILISLIWNFCV
jgi:NSS family neurotransmitter:Na+ symporter